MASHGGQISRAAVRDGDRGVGSQKHHGHGLAYDVGAADHHGVLAAQILHADGFQHLHAAVGSAGLEANFTHHQRTGAGHVEAVHILGGGDGFDDLVVVNMLGQGQLHQNAVDAGVVVQRFDAGQQLGFSHGSVVLFQHGMKAHVFAGLDLVAHIDLRGLVVAHQNDGQAGRDALGFESCRTRGDFLAQLFGEGFAVDDLGCHCWFTNKKCC